MTQRQRLVSALLLVAASAVVTTRAEAQAEPEPVRLSWVRGPGAHGCRSPQQIADQVAARLGRSPFTGDAGRSIEVYLTHGEGGWRAEIFVRDREGGLAGSRELTSEAADCAPIEAAGVLALALAIDPDAAIRPPPAAMPPGPAPVRPSPEPPRAGGAPRGALEPLPEVPPLPASLPPPITMGDPGRVPQTPPIAPRAPPPPGNASSAALRVGAGLGLLPRVAAAVSLAVEVAVAPAVRVTGGALWMPDARAADARFAFGLSAFALGACFSPVQRERVDLAVCGGLWGGALHAVVFDLTPVDPGQHPWVGAEASPRLRVRIAGRLHAELGASLIVPLLRQPFTVTGWPAPVFQQTPVTLLPFGGLGATFP